MWTPHENRLQRQFTSFFQRTMFFLAYVVTFLGQIHLFFISNTLKGLHQRKKYHPIHFIAAKFSSRKKKIFLNDFIKEN